MDVVVVLVFSPNRSTLEDEGEMVVGGSGGGGGSGGRANSCFFATEGAASGSLIED